MSRRAKITYADWVNDVERRVTAGQRQRGAATASDLMGPGLAPTAVQVLDWNDEVMGFNGFYFSDLGALNSPDPTKRWIGYSTADAAGNGVQTVWVYVTDATALAAWSPTKKARAFASPDGTTRIFSTWQAA